MTPRTRLTLETLEGRDLCDGAGAAVLPSVLSTQQATVRTLATTFETPSATSSPLALLDREDAALALEAEAIALRLSAPATTVGWQAGGGFDHRLTVSTNHQRLYDTVVTQSGLLVGAYQDGSIEIRALATGTIQRTLHTGIGRAQSLAVLPGSDTVFVSAGAGSTAGVIAFDVKNGRELWRRTAGDFTNNISVSPDGARVVVDVDVEGYLGGSLGYDAETGVPLGPQAPSLSFGSLALSGNRTLFFSQENREEVFVREAHGTQRSLTRLSGLRYTGSVAVDGVTVAIAGGSTIRILQTQTGASRDIVTGATVTQVQYLSDGSLAVGRQDGVLEVWSADGSKKTHVRQTGAYVRSIAEAGEMLVIQTSEDAPAWLAARNPVARDAREALEARSTAIAVRRAAIHGEREALATQAAAEEAARIAVFAEGVVGEAPWTGLTEESEAPATATTAAETVTEEALRATIRTTAMTLPGLLRRSHELTRIASAARVTENTARVDQDSAERYLAERRSAVQSLYEEIDHLRRIGRDYDVWKVERNIGPSRSMVDEAEHRLAAAQAGATSAGQRLATLVAEQASVLDAITDAENAIADDSATLIEILTATVGETQARADVTHAIEAAQREGHDALPHVRPNVTILDTTFASGDGEAYWLADLVREVREHRSPVLTTAGGMLKVLGRVTNDGNRSGVITVVGTGTSDLTPDAPAQHTLALHLEPGESRDFVMTIAVPRGQSRPGSLTLKVTTLDEPEMRYDRMVQQPKSNDPAPGYGQGGGGAQDQHIRVILESPDSEYLTQTKQQRINAMLAARPATTLALIEGVHSGIVTLSQDVETALRTALQSTNVRVALGLEPLMLVADASEKVAHPAAPEDEQNTDGAEPALQFGQRLETALQTHAFATFIQGWSTHENSTTIERETAFLWITEHPEKAALQLESTSLDANILASLRSGLIPAASAEQISSIVVESGDTLSAIAARSGTTVAEILDDQRNAFLRDARHNNGSMIFAGEIIWLPNDAASAAQSFWSQIGAAAGSAWGRMKNVVGGWWAESTESIDIVNLIGDETWQVLTDGQKERIQKSLEFEDDLPVANKKVIDWLLETFVHSSSSDIHHLVYDPATDIWIGVAYAPEDGPAGLGGECKWWADDIVAKNALNLDLPSNVGDEVRGAWLESDKIEPISDWNSGSLGDALLSSAKAGDFLQVDTADGSRSQHTMIVGRIDTDGVWFFDSNYGGDDRVQYHKISLESLNNYDRFTIYRAKEDL